MGKGEFYEKENIYNCFISTGTKLSVKYILYNEEKGEYTMTDLVFIFASIFGMSVPLIILQIAEKVK